MRPPLLLFLWQSVFERNEPRAALRSRWGRQAVEVGFAISVDLDHTQVLLAFLEVLLYFMAIVMFVFLFELLQ